MQSIIYKKCKECQERTPHRRMENREDSSVICEVCEHKEAYFKDMLEA